MVKLQFIRYNSKKHRNASAMIARQRWNKLSDVLLSAKDGEKDIPRSNECGNSSGLINVACQHNPPLSIIEELSALDSKAFFQKNSDGQLPLHIAAKYGVSADVFSYIIKKNPEAIMAQDMSGKTPLHLLFQNYNRKKKLYGAKVNNTMIQIIDLLCLKCPRVLVMEDEEDICPIESAIAQEIDFTIIGRLQKISREFHELSKISTRMRTLAKEKPASLMTIDKIYMKSVSRRIDCRRNSKCFAAKKKQLGSCVA